MKLSYGGQCGRNGFMAYIGSGNRPVLSASHAGYIPRTSCWFSIFTRFASAHPMRVASAVLLRNVQLASFASAHPIRVASIVYPYIPTGFTALPQRIPCGLHRPLFPCLHCFARLCLSASHAGCIHPPDRSTACACALPQRIPCGLHPGISYSSSFQGNSPLPQRIPCGLHPTFSLLQYQFSPLPQRIPCGLHRFTLV